MISTTCSGWMYPHLRRKLNERPAEKENKNRRTQTTDIKLLRQRGLAQVLELLKLIFHYVAHELCSRLTSRSSKVLGSVHACSYLQIVWILMAASGT